MQYYTFEYFKQPPAPLKSKKKKLTEQQQKVKQIGKVSKVCLRKDESTDKQSLYRCMMREAKTRLSAL